MLLGLVPYYNRCGRKFCPTSKCVFQGKAFSASLRRSAMDGVIKFQQENRGRQCNSKYTVIYSQIAGS